MVATIYVCCWAIGEVISVIEMVVDEKDDREVHKVGMVFSILAAEIIQVLDSIAWVRCASGNVFNPTLHLTYKAQIGKRPLSLHL